MIACAWYFVLEVSQVQRVKQSDYKIIGNQCARAIDDILFV